MTWIESVNLFSWALSFTVLFWIIFHGPSCDLIQNFMTLYISYIWFSSRSWACPHTPIAPVPFSHAESAALCEITLEILKTKRQSNLPSSNVARPKKMLVSQRRKPLDKFVIWQVHISNETINEHDTVWEGGVALETDGFQPKRWCCLASRPRLKNWILYRNWFALPTQ